MFSVFFLLYSVSKFCVWKPDFSESACRMCVSCMQLDRFTSAFWDGFFKKSKHSKREKEKGEMFVLLAFVLQCSEPRSTLLLFCFLLFSYCTLWPVENSYGTLQLTKCFKTFCISLNDVFIFAFFVLLPLRFALYGDMYSNLNEGLVQCYPPFPLFTLVRVRPRPHYLPKVSFTSPVERSVMTLQTKAAGLQSFLRGTAVLKGETPSLSGAKLQKHQLADSNILYIWTSAKKKSFYINYVLISRLIT